MDNLSVKKMASNVKTDIVDFKKAIFGDRFEDIKKCLKPFI